MGKAVGKCRENANTLPTAHVQNTILEYKEGTSARF